MRRFVLAAAVLVTAIPSLLMADQDDLALQQKLAGYPQVEVAQKPVFNMAESISNLRLFNAEAKGHMVRCTDVTKAVVGGKYLYTTDAAGKACHIYDLSFPNLKALMNKKQSTQIPVQRMAARDYINWLDGNDEAVEGSINQYQKNFNPRVAGNQSWIAKLKFKNKVDFVPGSKVHANDVGLPQSFRLSDLDFGNNFQFDPVTRDQIQKLLMEVDGVELSTSDYLKTVMARPETLLESVKFNWNDLKKVYDVFLEGEFLPIRPVALVEYQAQYKYAVEKQIRSYLASGLMNLVQMIPNPTIAAAVGVLVTDSFEQLEMAYDYQMLQLEDTLKTVDPAISGRALNVLYGQKADLLSAYLTALVQHKPFDWNALEKQGYAARYAVEKTRKVTMSRTNSKLVLEKKCQMEFLHDNFGICTKKDNTKEIYSLISERVEFQQSYGAPLIYSYKKPMQTTMRRGLAWFLSMGLRVLSPAVGMGDTSQLNSILKDYMHVGVTDEALLRNYMIAKSGQSELTKWLYIQNLNFFLPKSAAAEAHVIETNKKLLGVL